MIKQRIQKRYRRAVDAVKQDKLYYIFAVLSLLCSAVFAAIMISRTLPFAEGWYTYYSKCIENGLLPYRDFEYLYSPIYIYSIALITGLFGYDLMILRSLGVLLFALIALGVYLSVSLIVGKKRSWIALIASLFSTFYMQTEVVQIFYDYVRLMDVCAVFSLYFLLRTVKNMVQKEPCTKSLVALGILLALFSNIKQNTGMIFAVYSLVLIAYIGFWSGARVKEIFKHILTILVPTAIVTIVIYGAIFLSGSLGSYLSMTGLAAASAKGGMQAILFGWLFNNKDAFIDGLWVALFSILLLVGLFLVRLYLNKKNITLERKISRLPTYLLGFSFSFVLIVGLFLLKFFKSFATWLSPDQYWSPYVIFLTVFPLFVACGVWGIVDMVRKKQTMSDTVLLFSLAGAYFAIAFACGNSGGLAEGQATFGVALIVTAILLFLDSLHLRLFQGVAVALCLVLTLQCANKKMLATYSWWGMDESDYWASTEEMDLSLLNGIRVSPETKHVYESICAQIVEHTDPDDPIFCFPQIPLFYNLCDRSDPGTFTKVQWFDVATDQSVLADIEVLKNNPPKAILIYNTADGAYDAHEKAFRNGEVSGTRIMREFLYNYVSDQGYRFCGRYYANNNSLSLWIADDTEKTPSINFERGSGSAEDPYVIATPEQLQYFSYMVSAGRTFAGQYVRQEGDIDMEGYEFIPIGNAEEGTYFAGVYDGGDSVICNIILPDGETDQEMTSFFGTSRGVAFALTFENCPFSELFP